MDGDMILQVCPSVRPGEEYILGFIIQFLPAKLT